MKYELNLPSGVIKHGVLENAPFIDDVPLETSIYRGFAIAMFDCQRVSRFIHMYPQEISHSATILMAYPCLPSG